jgi:hypothetical protein
VKVNLKQCQNIAYGTCQNKAKETAMRGACVNSFNGFNQCNRQQVRGVVVLLHIVHNCCSSPAVFKQCNRHQVLSSFQNQDCIVLLGLVTAGS